MEIHALGTGRVENLNLSSSEVSSSSAYVYFRSFFIFLKYPS